MIDIHAHILPGIDDGAEDMYDTLEMARMAADSGVDKIIATPHCNIPGMYGNYFGREYLIFDVRSPSNTLSAVIFDDTSPERLSF